tara:strand:+ start:780 stop:956 length:177 start_codon:yes stop_codon:yes gene_type:complete
MAWEDFWWDTYYEIKKLGIKEEFDAQLKKMDTQSKHRYKDSRARWEYALNKIKKQKVK